MREAKCNLDKMLGMEVYISDTDGIGGKIRYRLEDFIVEEITKDKIRVHTSITSTKPPSIKGCSEGAYTWFILEKRNLDTISAIRILARESNISHKMFSIAGLKDSKAITAQMACVIGLSPNQLLSYKDKYGNITIRAAFRMPFKLSPGMLYGNHFIITIRNITLSKADIEQRIREILKEIYTKGIPAFYGYQRFGTIRPNTHIIGKHIIQGNFEEAIMELVAHAYPHEPPHIAELREYVKETHDFKSAYEKFPRAMSHERTVLSHLVKKPNDFAGAIRKLPIWVRRLFISAYQSYLFNKCLSERIKRGLPINEAVIGDLVAIKTSNGSIGSIIVANEQNLEFLNNKIKEGKMCLVLNVFGYRTIIREGPQGDIERTILKKEGITLEDFKVKHMPELSTKGYYRKASFLPENLHISDILPDEFHKGCYKVTLEFTLGKGLYATVLLRELMKPDDIIKAGF